MSVIYIFIAFLILVYLVYILNDDIDKSKREKDEALIEAEIDEHVYESIASTEKMEEAFQKHKDVLRRKMKLLVDIDDYGYEDRSAWENEKKHLIQKICPRNEFPLFWKDYDERLESALSMSSIKVTDEWVNEFFQGDQSRAYEHICSYQDEYDDLIEKGLPSELDCFRDRIDIWLHTEDKDINVDYKETFSGIGYENYCAELLENAGWETRLTSSVGDQGVDIVATQLETTVVFQCKKYSSPVGNKAVQEVVAGMGYMGGNGACVVTNSTFTKSAKELAKANGVKLMHHDELASLISTDFEPVQP